MILSIHHRTRHQYEAPVSFSDHALFLRPQDSHQRRVRSFELKTKPASSQRWVRDVYGNLVRVCNFGLQTSAELEFDLHMELELADENPFDFILKPYATAFPFDYETSDAQALQPFLDKSQKPGSLRVLDWFYSAVSQPIQHPDIVQFLAELNSAIHKQIDYVRRDEEGIQDPDLTLEFMSGSCRDMAMLFVAIVRQLGLAARFVSGYLYDPPVEDGENHFFNRAVGSMHAWAEVYLPGAGWKGFDPTNGILANGFFVPSAVSHDPKLVDPVQGNYFSKTATQSTLEVELHLERLNHE
ncbi:transglutaminase family protein [Coraliomargarita parva]|uniref:transglutaminase family protein n=1 Tax=Coraliomargarita parva TaxID=3014050 RepID=UPI0022B5A331|nr:transglutaminase family protein [Coraliomargarita parva]